MEIRKIKLAEREEILLGDRYAYGNWIEDKTDINLETTIPEQTIGIFIKNKVVSSLRIHRFQQSIRGVVKEMGGIGGVWTYPEYRNQGYVKELLDFAFKEMKANGQGLSMLIPFKQSFYQKFGYVTANSNLEVRVPLDGIISNFKDDLSTWEYERINASKTQSEFIEFILSTNQNHGMVIPCYWERSQWHEATKDKFCILVKRDEIIVAAGIYRIDSRNTERKIFLDHYFYTDITSRLRLFSFLAKHRDQINYLYLESPFGTNFQQWFGDVVSGYEININTPPYMVRIIDLVTAIDNLPIPKYRLEDGLINIQVDDSFCAWNSHIFTLESQDHILKIRQNPHVKPDLKFTIQGISALVYGTLSLTEMEYKNWLEVINHEKRSLLETWFPTVFLHNTWKF